MHFAYLRQASSFSRFFLRFGKRQSRKGNLSVMRYKFFKMGCRLMLTHLVSFSSQITAHFSLIFELILDQVYLLYLFLRSIHFQVLMFQILILLEISMLRGTFSPDYLGEYRFSLFPTQFLLQKSPDLLHYLIYILFLQIRMHRQLSLIHISFDAEI